MGKALSILGGLVAIVAGVALLLAWWGSLIEVLKGTVPGILILGGLIALIAGISELKDSAKAKKEEKK